MHILAIIELWKVQISIVSIVIILILISSFIVGSKSGFYRTFIKLNRILISILFTIFFHSIFLNYISKLSFFNNLQQDTTYFVALVATYFFFYIFIGLIYKLTRLNSSFKNTSSFWMLGGFFNFCMSFIFICLIFATFKISSSSHLSQFILEESKKESTSGNFSFLNFMWNNFVTNKIYSFFTTYLPQMTVSDLFSPIDIFITKIKSIFSSILQIIRN